MSVLVIVQNVIMAMLFVLTLLERILRDFFLAKNVGIEPLCWLSPLFYFFYNSTRGYLGIKSEITI